jgi:Ca-activated chloride channel homolog
MAMKNRGIPDSTWYVNRAMRCLLMGVTLGICWGARPAPAGAQEPPLESLVPMMQRHIIRVSSNLVMVPVSVTDAGGNVVKDLEMKDFTIDEDGQPVSIARVSEPGQTPLALTLLYDISGSVSNRFDFEKEAATDFLQTVFRPGDTVAILTIGPQPQILQESVPDLSLARQSLAQLQPTRGATAFFDSIVMAARLLSRTAGTQARRVQIVLSDGEDNNSETNQLIDALREIQRADCIFYSVNPAGASIRLNTMSSKGQEGMRALAAETGGAAFIPDSSTDLHGIFQRIAAELQAQYLLGYYSANTKADGAFHAITVRTPSRPGLRIRARQGYYAPRGMPSKTR